MFIKVTNSCTERQFYLNIEKIESFTKNIDCQGSAILVGEEDRPYRIKETPEEIMQLIKEASK